MRVCLRRGYHHAFDDLVRYPPKNIDYTIPKVASSRGQMGLVNVVKRKGWRLYSNLLRKPNVISVDCGPGVDLIHSNSGFLVKNKMPWVIDLEHVASFVGFESGRLEGVRDTVERYLSSDYCKKIMPWTKSAEHSIRNALNTRNFGEKIEVVYPAMKPLKIKRRKTGEISLLFVGYEFYGKGGKEILEACDILRKKFDFILNMVSDVPVELQKRYNHFNFVKSNIPRTDLLKKYFSSADVFVMPSYIDTFGMVLLEAMSVGIPVITSNSYAGPEIASGSGLTVDVSKRTMFGNDYLFKSSWKIFNSKVKRDKPEVVSDLVRKITYLIENKSASRKMAKHGKSEVSKGRFSVGERNKKLKRIYEESVEG